MAKSRLLEALAAIVAHVMAIPEVLPGIYPVSKEWMQRFLELDAAVEQLCKLAGVDIERGLESRHIGEVLAGKTVWFQGSTNLKLSTLTAHQAIHAELTGIAVLDDRSDWLVRMERVRIKAEIAEPKSSEKPARAQGVVPIGTDANGQFMDKVTAARGAWLLEEFRKNTTYATMNIRLKKKPSSWQTITGESGIRSALRTYCRKMKISLPKRQRGRPKKRRTKA